MGVFCLCCVLKNRRNLLFLKKKQIWGLLLIKKITWLLRPHMVIIYPFSVDISETQGEQRWIEISWDDDTPKNIDDVECDLLEMF